MKRLQILMIGLVMALFFVMPGSPPSAFAQKAEVTHYLAADAHGQQLAILTDNPAQEVAVVNTATPVTTTSADTGKSWFNENALPEIDPDGFLGLGWPYILAWLLGSVSLFYYIYPTAEKWKWLTWVLDVFVYFGPPNLRKGGGVHSRNLWQDIMLLIKG